MIKIFYCGRCNDEIGRTRYGLRKHLREEHLIKRRITNVMWSSKLGKYIKQPWWIEK